MADAARAPAKASAYSINRGLWGVSIGGTETLTSTGSIPEDAWVLSAGALTGGAPEPTSHSIGYTQGVPTALDGQAMDPVARDM